MRARILVAILLVGIVASILTAGEAPRKRLGTVELDRFKARLEIAVEMPEPRSELYLELSGEARQALREAGQDFLLRVDLRPQGQARLLYSEKLPATSLKATGREDFVLLDLGRPLAKAVGNNRTVVVRLEVRRPLPAPAGATLWLQAAGE